MGRRAIYAVYCAFVLSIPFETLLFFRSGVDRDSGVTVSRVLGLMLLGLALVQRRRCFRRIPAEFWLIAWYIGAYTLSQLWIPSALDVKFHRLQLTFVQLAALFLVSVNLFSDEAFRARLLRLYGWGVFLVALAMVLGALGAGLDDAGRGSLVNQNPNLTAHLFALGAICLAGDPLILAAGRRWPHVLLSLGAVGVMIGGILRTGSRGGLLAFIGGIAGLAACGARTTRAARVVIAGLVVVLLGMLVAREFRGGTATSARLERAWAAGDTAGRTGIYDAAWSMFLERPLLGYGGANNRFVLGVHMNSSDRDGRHADRETHNVFLAVLTEVGLVGGLPFIAAILLALWAGWRGGRRTGDALPFALMCALLVVNMATTGSREKIFWIVLAAAVASGAPRAVNAPGRA